MALTRSMLKGMNLTEEQVSAIIDAHTETTDALKKQRDEYKADAESLKTVQKELDSYKTGKDWKAEYDKLEKSFTDYKAEVAGKETLAAKKAAYRHLLSAENIPEKFHERIIKMTDFSEMELDGDKFKDEDAQKKTIQTEWGEYVATNETHGANVETPPKNTATQMTKEQILAIKDTTERQKAIAQNINLFR